MEPADIDAANAALDSIRATAIDVFTQMLIARAPLRSILAEAEKVIRFVGRASVSKSQSDANFTSWDRHPSPRVNREILYYHLVVSGGSPDERLRQFVRQLMAWKAGIDLDVGGL